MAETVVGVIGGTGLEDAISGLLKGAKGCRLDTPFGKPSSEIMVGRLGKNNVAVLNRHGKGHKLAPGQVPFAANIYALKKLGVRTIIATGAVGSLRQRIKPAELVVVDQFIDKTYKRQNSFFDGIAAVDCEMAHPVCSRVAGKILQAAKKNKIKTHRKGTYVCMEGPQFSTSAESVMHRLWGADLVGMTAMPEAKLAREAQICYALVSLVSDYDCWRQRRKNVSEQTLLREILANLKTATYNCIELIKAVLEGDGSLIDEGCHCRKSLALAVWTDRKLIRPADEKKLRLLFK